MENQWKAILKDNQFFIHLNDKILVKVSLDDKLFDVQVGINPVIASGEIKCVDEYRLVLSLDMLPAKSFNERDFSANEGFAFLNITGRHDLMVEHADNGLIVQVWRDGKKVIVGSHIMYDDIRQREDDMIKVDDHHRMPF